MLPRCGQSWQAPSPRRLIRHLPGPGASRTPPHTLTAAVRRMLTAAPRESLGVLPDGQCRKTKHTSVPRTYNQPPTWSLTRATCPSSIYRPQARQGPLSRASGLKASPTQFSDNVTGHSFSLLLCVCGLWVFPTGNKPWLAEAAAS